MHNASDTTHVVDPEFWEQFWHILQFLQLVLIAFGGWVWRKMSIQDSSVRELYDKHSQVDLDLLKLRGEMHKTFVTKIELRDMLDAAVSPLHKSIDRVDDKLDRLIDRQLSGHSRRSTDTAFIKEEDNKHLP